MTRLIRLLSIACLPILACGAPHGGPDPRGAQSARQMQSGSEATQSSEEMQASTTDISDKILFTFVMGSVDEMLSRSTGYILPHLPPPLRAMIQPDAIKQQLFAVLGIPGMEQAADTGRPLALAMTDPESGSEGPLSSFLVAVPVRDGALLINSLKQRADRHERTPQGDYRFTIEPKTVHLRLVDGYALAAMDERLLRGAPGVLLPLVKQTVGKEARLRLEMAVINRLYGAKIDRILQKLDAKASQGGGQGAGLARSVAKWMGYVKSINHLSFTVALDPGDIRAQLALVAEPSGSFPDYLGQQKPGPAWGAKYLPQDSALVYLSREDPQYGYESFTEGISALADGDLKGLVSPAFVDQLGQVMKKSFLHQTGQYAVGLWGTADGGLGLGGVTKLTDVDTVRQAWIEVWKLVSKELDRVMTTGLPPALKKELQGLRLKLNVRPGQLRVAGVKGDLVEVAIRWPRFKDKQMRKRVNEVKKGLAQVMGKRLVLAFAYHQELSFMTLGKDYRQRLAQMIAVAKGGKSTGMQQAVDKLVGNKPLVAFVYIPVAALAAQIMRVVEQLITVPPQLRQGIYQILPGPDVSTPVTGLMRVQGPKLIWDMSVSSEVVGMLARSIQIALMASRAHSAAQVPAPAP